MSARFLARAPIITLPPLLEEQWQAFWALRAHRFKALRCGRRFGKTEFAKAWIGQGLVQGEVCAWFAPQQMTSLEVHRDLTKVFEPFLRIEFEDAPRYPPAQWRPSRLLVVGEFYIVGRGRGVQGNGARTFVTPVAFTHLSRASGSGSEGWKTRLGRFSQNERRARPSHLRFQG